MLAALALLTTHHAAAIPLNVELDGEHVRITTVEFTGNAALTTEDLQPRLQTQPSPGLFSRLVSAFSAPYRYLSSVALAQDSVLLVDLYRDHGYFFAQIEHIVTIDSLKATGSVVFAIREGRQCAVDSFDIQCVGELGAEFRSWMRTLVAPLVGKPYSKAAMRDSLSRILEGLQDNGYGNASLSGNPIVRLNRSAIGVTISAVIAPGPRFRIGDIRIEYDPTAEPQCIAEKTVRNAVEFQHGELFSRTKIYRTEDNLRMLNIFEVVHVEMLTQFVDTATREAPMRIFLRPKRPIDLSPDLVASSDFGSLNIGADLTLTHHNIFCGAQELSLSTSVAMLPSDIKKHKIDVLAKFFQPHVRLGSILDYNTTSLQFAGGYTLLTFPRFQRKYTASAQLSIREATYTYLIPQLAFVHVQSDTAGINAGANVTGAVVVPKQPNLIASVSLTRNNTNNLFVPSAGSAQLLTLKANLLNTPHFGKIEATGKWFVASGALTVFAFRTHGGLIWRFGDVAKDILLDEKFYAGGAYSVRGWGLYELGMGIPDDIKTGYTVFEASAEWRYRLFQLPETWFTTLFLNPLSSGIFIDVGQVWNERRTFASLLELPKQLAVAVGLGIRRDFAVGPVRLDLGYKLYDPASGTLQHFASTSPKWPYIRVVHPTLQLAIGNAY